MNSSILIGLIHNTALLLSFTMLYQGFGIRIEQSRKIHLKLLLGLVIGAIGIILMMTPWILMPGIVFDTRSVMLACSGLYFGALPTLVAMVVTGGYRLIMGGGGTWMGLAVIMTSGLIGIGWRKLRPGAFQEHTLRELVIIGILVHLLMFSYVNLLPAESRRETFENLLIPIIFVYPAATVLLGLLMKQQLTDWQNRYIREDLRETERRLTEIFKSANLVTIILDEKHRLTFCNPYFLEITGYREEELLGLEYFPVFLPARVRQETIEVLEGFVKGDDNARIHENPILTRAGRELNIRWNNTRLFNNKGQVCGIAAVGVNITEQLFYERSLVEQNMIIARQNEEYRLLNEELQRAMEKAEESNRLKSAFLANMSHEIRTPMNGILGFADLLKEPHLTGKQQRQYLSVIEKSGARLLGIINNLVDISRIESGQMDIKLSRINLNQVLQDVHLFFLPEAGLKGLRLEFGPLLPMPMANIITDSEKLYAILTNLVKNAVKYSEKGTIRMGAMAKESLIEFFVSDEGIGIAEEDKMKIFDRFVQSEVRGYSKFEGAGLGLAISKAYVEMMGGTIGVESEAGRGSVFRFTLPAGDAAEDQPIADETLASTPDPAIFHDLRILIAEDEELADDYITRVVERYCACIYHAQTGDETIALAKEHPELDIILMDLRLPPPDGYEATREIRSFNREVAIIAQTAFALTGDREKALSAGCDDYITKPIQGKILLEKMMLLAAERRKGQPLQPG